MITQADILVIGAGPIGLAMAAKLTKTNLNFIILEKGTSVGANILEWGHVSLFTNWAENMDTDARHILQEHGIALPPLDTHPTGKEFVEKYLRPLSKTAVLGDKIMLDAAVTHIEYEKSKKLFKATYFVDGQYHILKSRVVIDASGTWGNFNRLATDAVTNNIMYGIARASVAYSNKTLAVVGSGHSAMNSLQALASLELKGLHWLIRGKAPKFGKSKVGGRSNTLENDIKQLLEQQKVELHPNFLIEHIHKNDGHLALHAQSSACLAGIDELIVNAGTYPDYSFVPEMSLDIDERFMCARTLAPKIDPSLHTCSSTSYGFEDTLLTQLPYFVVGMKSFGKASNFLLLTGYNILGDLLDRLRHFFQD